MPRRYELRDKSDLARRSEFMKSLNASLSAERLSEIRRRAAETKKRKRKEAVEASFRAVST